MHHGKKRAIPSPNRRRVFLDTVCSSLTARCAPPTPLHCSLRSTDSDFTPHTQTKGVFALSSLQTESVAHSRPLATGGLSRLALVVGSDDGVPGVRPVTIYDVAEAAGVAASTVSRALSKPGRVSFRTAEHVRTVAARLGYRTEDTERDVRTDTSLIAMVVADITNPVFYGMIRGAERAARHAGCTMVLAESQESAAAEHEALQRIVPAVDAVVLASSRMSDSSIRTLAKSTRVVVLNRLVDQVPSVATDTIGAVRVAAQHLLDRGHSSYLPGRAGGFLVRRHAMARGARGGSAAGPQGAPDRALPTHHRRRPEAAAEWLRSPSSAVIAYNDLLAIGFQQASPTRVCGYRTTSA